MRGHDLSVEEPVCSIGCVNDADDSLVQSDARALIERFGADAYFEARLGQHDDDVRVIDGNRPPGHWARVKRAIARERELKADQPNGE